MSGDGRGCNGLAGAFAVDEVSYDRRQGIVVLDPVRPTLRENEPPLYGALRWTRPGG